MPSVYLTPANHSILGNLFLSIRFKVFRYGKVKIDKHFKGFMGLRQGPPAVIHALPYLSEANMSLVFGGFLGKTRARSGVMMAKIMGVDPTGGPIYDRKLIHEDRNKLSKNSINVILNQTKISQKRGPAAKYKAVVTRLDIEKLRTEDFGAYYFYHYLEHYNKDGADRSGRRGYFIGMFGGATADILLPGRRSIYNTLFIQVKSCSPFRNMKNGDIFGIQLGETTCLSCTVYGKV